MDVQAGQHQGLNLLVSAYARRRVEIRKFACPGNSHLSGGDLLSHPITATSTTSSFYSLSTSHIIRLASCNASEWLVSK
jgi:hypothetical protein